MLFSATGTFCSCNSFTAKNGNPCFTIKIHDDESEEYLVMFCQKELFDRCSLLGKHTPVKLTVKISDKYSNLIDVEPMKQK